MQELYSRLQDHFTLGELTVQRPNLAFITVDRTQLRGLLLHLRDVEGFAHMVLLTAVDWIEDNKFQLTYLLHNRGEACDVGLRVMLPRDAASMDSIHDIWPTAETYQRELREMFGIDFPDSPGVMEEFILEGWAGPPPYRRDFDTKKFSEENFVHRPGRETRDPAEHMKEQLYPDRA
ncbi:MAG: NADH-quinone oxidoreductase subunit C [Hyphomicrobiales bacterium]|nr:MAG: NADH-quinone oxidoreductase subunit C [Hyphomicrobiales bacterium]